MKILVFIFFIVTLRLQSKENILKTTINGLNSVDEIVNGSKSVNTITKGCSERRDASYIPNEAVDNTNYEEHRCFFLKIMFLGDELSALLKQELDKSDLFLTIPEAKKYMLQQKDLAKFFYNIYSSQDKRISDIAKQFPDFPYEYGKGRQFVDSISAYEKCYIKFFQPYLKLLNDNEEILRKKIGITRQTELYQMKDLYHFFNGYNDSNEEKFLERIKKQSNDPTLIGTGWKNKEESKKYFKKNCSDYNQIQGLEVVDAKPLVLTEVKKTQEPNEHKGKQDSVKKANPPNDDWSFLLSNTYTQEKPLNVCLLGMPPEEIKKFFDNNDISKLSDYYKNHTKEITLLNIIEEPSLSQPLKDKVLKMAKESDYYKKHCISKEPFNFNNSTYQVKAGMKLIDQPAQFTPKQDEGIQEYLKRIYPNGIPHAPRAFIAIHFESKTPSERREINKRFKTNKNTQNFWVDYLLCHWIVFDEDKPPYKEIRIQN